MTTSRLTLAMCTLIVVLLASCAEESSAPEPSGTVGSSGQDLAPDACILTVRATRASLEGTPTWARFCPGRRGYTAPAEVPSDALTSHLDVPAGLRETPRTSSGRSPRCDGGISRTYRLQIGYADGTVAQVTGRSDPDCHGRLDVGAGAIIHGPEDLGVFGAAMKAFGQQYADDFDAATSRPGFSCPSDPGEPDSIDLDDTSATLDTGYHLGRRSPMLMPLTGVRGIVCTWAPGDERPSVETLTEGEAERVRIGLHAIAGGFVDWPGMPEEPTVTAVVEDKTGTRRGVTIIKSECATVIRSNEGYGLGFAWLDH